MSMPETSIHHDYNTIFRKYDVWPSRQFPVLQTESEPSSMKPLPDQNLRFGVLATNGRHALAALLASKDVRHRGYQLMLSSTIVESNLPLLSQVISFTNPTPYAYQDLIFSTSFIISALVVTVCSENLSVSTRNLHIHYAELELEFIIR